MDDAFPPSSIWSSTSANYDWPRNTIQDNVKYVTHGRFENLPQTTSKVVRIFLSSTFTDFYTERNCLMKTVYPKLQRLCKEKFDLDFQVVDMRWGIRNEASVDHSASELCMKEIHSCQKLSVGPTFVTLLSHRYGGRHLPAKISLEEMQTIIDIIKSEENSEEGLKIVEKWYKLDTNAIPNEYILQSVVDQDKIESFLEVTKTSKNHKDYDIYDSDEEYDDLPTTPTDETEKPKKYGKLVAEGKKLWKQEESLLISVVRSAVRKAIEQGRISEESGQKYIQSITEEEIREGILKESSCKDRVLAFVRDIEDINIKHEKAWRFVEIKDGEINEETNTLMKKVRDVLIPQYVPRENIYHFKTKWSDNEGINKEDHSEYIKDFCKMFENAIIDLVERAASKTSVAAVGKIYPEALEHGHQCVQKVERFHGREDILNKIKSYLMSTSDQPLVIHGESGCGKTSVLAKAAMQIPLWLGDDNNSIVILRFLGTTPDSSTVYKTLASVSEQLVSLLNLQSQFPELPQEFSDLKNVFKDILNAVPSDKRVVIFLDSLDQLSATNNAHKLLWFPSHLSQYVKFVVSTLPKEHGILNTLKSDHMNLKVSQFVPVENLETNTSHEIISLWLSKINRCLSKEQEKVTEELLRSDVRPLYLKLVFDEISLWKSYENPIFNCPTIPSCLQRLYKKLEMKHGKILVSKALGYLSASHNGLTQIEIEDILSLDDDVLNDVFEFHVPPIRRLPSILWSRIRSDMTEYIVDRDADGAKVMAWYHRQFIQEAHKKYLPGSSAFSYSGRSNKSTLPLYKTLADYFAGVWANGKPKPFKYTEKQAEKLNKDSVDGEADRYVPKQPVLFTSESGTIDLENLRYNRRKLSELPAALSTICNFEDNTEYIAEHIGLNQEFLAAWIKHTPWEEISEFMNTTARESKHADEIEEMTKLLRKEKHMANNEGEEERDKKEMLDWNAISTGTNSLILQISTIQQCLLLSYISVLHNPTYLGVDITGRLLHYNGILDGISSWIKYTDTVGRKLCALVPPHMQLETAGSELMLIINNHLGPVNTAVWAKHDNNICISASKKLVAVSLEAGQITIDTRPRSMPKGDCFKEITTVEIKSEAYYLASLSENPWVYIFDSEGEVLDIMDFSLHLPDMAKPFKITNMQITTKGSSLYVTDSSLPYIVFVDDVLEKDKKFKVVSFDANIQLQIVISIDRNIPLESEREKLVVLDTKNTFYLCDSVGTISFKKSFDFPKVTASHFSISLGNNKVHIVLGFETGQICIICLRDMHKNDVNIYQVYLFTESQIRVGAQYGIPHYVHHFTPMEHFGEAENYKIGLACTNTHLVAFASKHFLYDKMDSSSEDEDSDDEQDPKRSTLQLITICRIKKKYNMAIYTPKLKFILAAHGGIIDIFKIGNPSMYEAEGSKLKVTFFVTIDAHGQDITRILPTDEDILFMTSSKDSSLKFFMLARAGVIRKYIPNFDHSESAITKIIPGEDYALTFSDSSRFIHQWEIVHGRIKKVFQHPHNEKFLKCAADYKMHTVMALDEKGKVFCWFLVKKQRSTLTVSRVRKRTTSKLGPSKAVLNSKDVAAPEADKELESYINFHSDVAEDDIHMFVFKKGITVIASKKSPEVFILDPGKPKMEASKIGDLKGPFDFAVKLKEEKILFVSSRNHVCIYNIVSMKVEFNDLKILGSEPIDNIKYLAGYDEVIFTTKNIISSWKPQAGGKVSKLHLEEPIGFANVHLMTSTSSNLFVLDSNKKYYAVLDINTKAVLQKRNITVPTPIQMNTCTSDGKYLVFVSGDKHVYLIRVIDGKLLAWYTMYDTIRYITTSENSWYVLIATSDRRLFVLIIADPDEREHDDRIQFARTLNPSLTLEEAMAMMGDVTNFEGGFADSDSDEYFDSSDDEAIITITEKRLQKRAASALGKTIKVLYSSDSSDDEEELSTNTKKVGPTADNKNVGYADNQVYTSTPCSVQ